MTTNKNTTVFTLRINVELLKSIKEAAEKNKRSAAKEIEYQLEQIYKKK